MKELSIEEKAARYDKAIEKLRSLHDDYDTVSTLIDIKEELEQIFPELKESDDERIRNLLYLLIRDRSDNGKLLEHNGVSVDMALAWLEKRGETFTKKDVDDAYLKGVCDAKQELEKQGEQNPAWSEEDKRKINRIYSILGQAADTHAFSTTCRLIGDKECVDLQDFLKSITLQNTWKPSDEQIKALDEVYKTHGANSVCRRIIFNLLEQLKKL